MAKLRVHNFAISLDGYGAGPTQNVDNPLGVGGEQLHEWVFETRTGRQMMGEEGGDEGIDDEFIAAGDAGIGATVMGRNMFGPIRGSWDDDEWKGWWGENPPYHHPVFVLTHHPRPPITMQGGTTFNFVDDGIEAALERALDAAEGKDGGSAAACPPSSSISAPAWSTRCTCRSCPCSSEEASDSSTTSTAAPRATTTSSSSAHRPLSMPACRERRRSRGIVARRCRRAMMSAC